MEVYFSWTTSTTITSVHAPWLLSGQTLQSYFVCKWQKDSMYRSQLEGPMGENTFNRMGMVMVVPFSFNPLSNVYYNIHLEQMIY